MALALRLGAHRDHGLAGEVDLMLELSHIAAPQPSPTAPIHLLGATPQTSM